MNLLRLLAQKAECSLPAYRREAYNRLLIGRLSTKLGSTKLGLSAEYDRAEYDRKDPRVQSGVHTGRMAV